MKRASSWFSDEERAAIEAAIASAEAKTAAEIVPVVATASGRYDRAEDAVGLLMAIAGLIVAWLVFPPAEASAWGGGAGGSSLSLATAVLVVVAGFAIGAALATRFPLLRLPFVTRAEIREEVERASNEAFYRLRVRRTAAGTGVLIYVSLYEHRVRVVGDEPIAAALEQAQWDEIRDLALAGLADGRAADGLMAAIERCGELCATAFPRNDDHSDGLDNTLHLLD